ncbi:MAG: prephenate dehydrogenase [Brevinematia bacterium]
MFKKIAIAGLGFIGGSISIALKSKYPDVELVGITRDISKVKSSKNSELIDVITDYSNLESLKNSDLVVICSNVSYIPKVFDSLRMFLSPSCVVTDVGSVKKFVVENINNPSFVGSHPMTGSDKSGFENADPSIFEGSLCVITPYNNEDHIVKIVSEFWKFLGMSTLIISPENHDKIVSQTSHFIHLVSYVLSYTLSKSDFAKEKFLGIFSKGLLDTTRVSKSDPELWVDIISRNKENVLSILDIFIKDVEKFKGYIERDEVDNLKNMFEFARDFRKSLD